MLTTFYKELCNNAEHREGILSVENLNILELVKETSNFCKSVTFRDYIIFYNDVKEPQPKDRKPSFVVPTLQGEIKIYGDFMVDSMFFYDDYLNERFDIDAGLDMLFLR